MNTAIYTTAVTEAANYADRDAYISDLALSSVWGDPEDADIPAARLEWLGQIWDATRRDTAAILAASGMNMMQLSQRLLIPYRTVQDWAAGKRTPPAWTLLLIQEALGLFSSRAPE